MKKDIDELFKSQDVTNRLSKGAQILLAPRIRSVIREYDEERPVNNTRRDKALRWIKKLILRLAYRYIYFRPMGHVESLLFRHWGLKGKLLHRVYNLIEDWKNEIYIRCFSRAIYVGVSARESQLKDAYKTLSGIIECSLGPEVIRGSISGAIEMPYNRSPEDSEQLYCIVVYLHTTRGFSELVNMMLQSNDGRKQLDRLFIFREGDRSRDL